MIIDKRITVPTALMSPSNAQRASRARIAGQRLRQEFDEEPTYIGVCVMAARHGTTIDAMRQRLKRAGVRDVPRRYGPKGAPRPAVSGALSALLERAAAAHGTTVEHLRGPQRGAGVVAARHDFCRQAFATGEHSITQIAEAIDRDHTTVCHALGHTRKSRRAG